VKWSGVPWSLAQRRGREHEGVVRELQPNRREHGLPGGVEVPEDLQGGGVEGETPVLVSLRALEPPLSSPDDVVLLDDEFATLDVHRRPAQCSQLTASGAGRDGEPQEHAELGGPREGGVEEASDVILGRRPRLAASR
jgi:hypothetical protein